jgi:hypothetical protein
VNSFKPLPVDPEKRRKAIYRLKWEVKMDFFDIAEAFGISLTEARNVASPRPHKREESR